MKNISTKKSIIVAILAFALCACAVFGVLFCKTAYSWLHAEKTVQPEAMVIDMPAVTATKFTTVLPDTDTYLYRAGNQNTVSLGTLFQTDSSNVTSSKVTVSVTALEPKSSIANSDGSGQCTYTIDAADWTQSTLKFSGEGPVCVKIREGNGEECALNLEVINGYNVTEYSQLKNSNNCVLLKDIEMSSGGSYRLSNSTLYGNGFTFDIMAGTHAANTQGVITLNNASIDNTRITGAVYTTYAASFSEEWYPAAVNIGSGNCTITSSYVSGCRSAVAMNGGNLVLENSTLYGGRLANLDMKGGNLTLRNVTTVNEPVTNDGTTVMGFGILIDTDATSASIKNEGTLTQYNWAKKSDSSYLPSSNSMNVGANFAFGSSCKQFQKTVDGVTYVNFGILNLSKNVATTIVSGQSSDYEFASQSSGAWVCTVKADSATASNMFAGGVPDYDEATYQPTKQGAVAPTFAWDYPPEYNTTSGNIVLSFEKGKSALLDPNFLTATKYGGSLSVGVKMDGADYTGKSITFSEATAGTYTHVLTYALTDPYNYNADITTYDQTYAFEVPVQVIVTEPEQKNAEFKYTDGSGTKTITINGKTYIMPDVSGTQDGKISSVLVGGQTVYMPIVEVKQNKSGSNVYFYSPAFSAINITDYDAEGNGTTYNTSIESLPKNFDVVSGNPYHPASNTSYRETEFKEDYGGLCYKSWKASSADIGATTQKVCFTFTDNAGMTYYYYVQYSFPSYTASSSGCVTPDTLITLADGTQKRVDSLDGTEMLLVWNMETGKLDSAPIMFIDSDPVKEYEVIHLYFSDGTVVKVISEHGFWDYDLNRYVYLDGNASEYIGHTFAKQNGSELSKVTLDRVEIKTETTSAWSPVTVGHLCYFTDGMLSMPGGVGGLFNIFDVDSETMTYDAEAMQRDIEKYGLFTYEELNAICPLPEEMFEAAGGKYLKVSIGKGNLTVDELVAMIDRYTNKFR